MDHIEQIKTMIILHIEVKFRNHILRCTIVKIQILFVSLSIKQTHAQQTIKRITFHIA